MEDMGLRQARLVGGGAPAPYRGVPRGSTRAWIRARRLDRVRRDLTDPALAGETIAAIGARWAFSGPAHLTRTFHATYGGSPVRCRSAHTR
jgi:AraC-like DNA-binding protein